VLEQAGLLVALEVGRAVPEQRRTKM
jgi:hypothetical protein